MRNHFDQSHSKKVGQLRSRHGSALIAALGHSIFIKIIGCLHNAGPFTSMDVPHVTVVILRRSISKLNSESRLLGGFSSQSRNYNESLHNVLLGQPKPAQATFGHISAMQFAVWVSLRKPFVAQAKPVRLHIPPCTPSMQRDTRYRLAAKSNLDDNEPRGCNT
ncbi:hypothetical protein BCR34DRAFT_94879 [Clohesyomyces aquaticus]|uniref:Uncharacterized protein n=1 Tax=Clohesyomyces aquaticus TaxID=1231657 RepID=A0A1Y2A1Y0_9PLEO|nr:hypothetical protein BCR34DRAFT_94879 [Clohesyomyces aquaticus]